MTKRWEEKDKEFLKKYYFNKKDKELSSVLKRSLKSISYMACKLKLKKDEKFYSLARKHLNFEICKSDLERLYVKEEKSIRKIAAELKISKNTVDYYLKKFSILKRTKSAAAKIRFKKESVWCSGLTKDTDQRLKKANIKRIRTLREKRENRIKGIESKFGMPINVLLNYLYWDKSMTQEKIARLVGFDRRIIIELMKRFSITLRPNYEYISKLKGKKHSMYGKTWEQIYGKERAKKIREMHIAISRDLIIKRIKNRAFPFFNTKIERIMAEEMQKRGINFIDQFNVDNKFVCDFAIPRAKLIIECDGDFWHANPILYDKSNRNGLKKSQIINLKRDKFKDLYLKKRGWKVLRFFESDIKANVVGCVDKIIQSIKENPQKS